MWLVRFFHPEHGVRIGLHREADAIYDVTETFPTFSAWLESSVGRVSAAWDALLRAGEAAPAVYPEAALNNPPSPETLHWLPPVDQQDVWAAGVTYERSREARQEEAGDGGDIYQRVYGATRPELFFKAKAEWVVGHYGEVGIRADSAWNVPEPELTLLMNPALEVVGCTVGNDMSSRSIEGENPLYLPQAKIYTASCALGHGMRLSQMNTFPKTQIELTIQRGDQIVFFGETNTDKIRRSVDELLHHLGHSLQFPHGAALMTGTGIVPPADFTLQASDQVRIKIEDVDELINTVKVIA